MPQSWKPAITASAAILALAGCGEQQKAGTVVARRGGASTETQSQVLATQKRALSPLSPSSTRDATAQPHEDMKSTLITQVPTVAECKGFSLPPARFWRLTDEQIANTLADVFGSPGLPVFQGFRTERFKEKFGNDPDRVLMTPDLVFSSLDSVTPVTDWIATNVADVNTCRTGSASCLTALRVKYGPLLWRRPITTAEAQTLDALLAKAGTDGATQDEKVRLLFQAFLLSPHFLFRSEVGSQATVEGRAVRALGPYEVASMLSYTAWASTPDVTLYTLASENKLSTPAQVKEQLDRLAASPKAKRGTQQVFDEWLGLRDVLTRTKDSSYSADLTADIRRDMRTEVERLLDDAIWTRNSDLADLFSTNKTFLNDRLARYYGFQSPGGTAFMPVVVDQAKRAGLMSSGAFVTAFSNDKGTGLVHRADFLLKHALCSPLPPPPPGIANNANGTTGELTTRQRFEQLHSANPACAGCHKSLDPIGGAFESWDSIGRFRTMEGSLPIDSSGDLWLGGKSEFAYQTGTEFLRKLSATERFAQCYSVKAYQAVAGVVPSDEHSCEVARMHQGNKAVGMKPKAVFSALSDLKVFLYRDERIVK